MEDHTPPDYLRSPFYGVESADTQEIWRAIRATRCYVRRHCRPEGLCEDWGESMNWADRLKVTFKAFDELNAAMLQHQLSMSALWLWPSCCMIILHKPSSQWVSIRCHAVALTGCDIPSARALAQSGALGVFLGAGNQTVDFEHHVQRLAEKQIRPSPG